MIDQYMIKSMNCERYGINLIHTAEAEDGCS